MNALHQHETSPIMEGSRTYPETSGRKIGHWESCQMRMKFVLRFLAASAGLLLLPWELPGAAVGADDPCSYVDPFIGTEIGRAHV